MYHCYSRCVQRAFLCGYDRETGTDYSHRKDWIEERQELLVTVFAMELLGYAILDNHMHHVIRTRPDVARQWSDEEVVRRWWRLHADKNYRGEERELTEDRLKGLLEDTEKIAEWRQRLASLSWYMKDLKENIAKRANQESGSSGHFFDSRFSSPRLADPVILLLCLLYVDLNAVRAGTAEKPEDSRYTSCWRRIQAWMRRRQRGGLVANPKLPDPDACLTPICETGESGNSAAPRHRLSDVGFLPLTTESYLVLVDWVGRVRKHGKCGAVPENLAPILDRLSGGRDYWSNAEEIYQQEFRLTAKALQAPGGSPSLSTT